MDDPLKRVEIICQCFMERGKYKFEKGWHVVMLCIYVCIYLYIYLQKDTMEGKGLRKTSSSNSEMLENDNLWMQSSTRFAPSCLAFSMAATISSLVSHSKVVQTSRSFLKPMWKMEQEVHKNRQIETLSFYN